MAKVAGLAAAIPALIPQAGAMRRAANRVVPYLVALAIGVGMLGFSLPLPDGVLTFTRAEVTALTDAVRPADDAAWTAVDLPHARRGDTASPTSVSLYRMRFTRPADDLAPWAILVPAFTSRIIVLINGARLADSRWDQPSLTITLNWPEFVPIPEPLLRPGVNTLDIRLETPGAVASFLDRVYAGPDERLRPNFEHRQFLLVTLPKLLFAAQIAFAVSLVIAWATRRREWECLLVGAILLVSAASALPIVLPASIPLPPDLLRLTNLAFFVSILLALPLALRFAGHRPPRSLGWGSLAVLAAIVGTVFWAPIPVLRVAAWYVLVPLGILVAAVSAGLVVKAAHRRNDATIHTVVAGTLLALAIILHDVLVAYGVETGDHVFLNRLGMPILLLLISGLLMRRFAMALNAVDRFNDKLRSEIVAAEAALRESFAREQDRDHAIALEAERSRLTRDLHDGLAGQLVSIVALSHRGDRASDAMALAARRALTDLRLVIASMADVGDDLGMMLANFHDHIEPQLGALGVALDWRMANLPDVTGLTSANALDIFRILQEATVNAARHSGETVVIVAMAPLPSGDGVRIVVEDAGRGGAVPRPGGHGLASMHRRAQAIGGTLAIETGPAGTRIILELGCLQQRCRTAW